MKTSLCRKLGYENIKKNYRFFIPRILTETGLSACFYIIFTLAGDTRLSKIKGGNYLPTFMWMGAVIIGLLSAVLMLYTNSFLMKQRRREFGLYSVLGLEKKHICRVLFHESAISSLLSVFCGLSGGILFYKISSLLICKLLKSQIIIGFYFITPKTIIPSGLIFIAIDLLTFIVNCIGIGRMKPVELLASRKKGEKEPKAKPLLFIAGLLFLFAGYYISVSTENPLKAIFLFFAAVIAVIIGTYLLFTVGSVCVLKLLKKREKFYYRPHMFTAVSGLLYRMKQNAVGLASVAVLATGVLVMISSTFCLYSRTESILNDAYPQDYYLSTVFYDKDGEFHKIPELTISGILQKSADNNGLKIKNSFSQTYFESAFCMENGVLTTDYDKVSADNALDNIFNLSVISEDMYVKLGGEPLGLEKNEVAVCRYNISSSFGNKTFSLFDKTYTVKSELTSFPLNKTRIRVNSFGMVVSDDSVFFEIFEGQRKAYAENASPLECRMCVTFDDKAAALENGPSFSSEVSNAVSAYITAAGFDEYTMTESDSFWETRENLYGMYGTLLFLGVLLGLVCLFATVLIIFYKQISEGYEDRERFVIMRKIGMTGREVKKTIHSQLRLIFFLPLLTAGIHTAFAFPILTRLMKILMLDNVSLFAIQCVIVYLVFALVYAFIYKLTAKTYYKIVY